MDARLLLLLVLAAAAAAAPLASAELVNGFYRTTCPDAEKVIFSVIQRRFKADPGTSALLLRLLFHDCFANGCDASILIDPLSNMSAEKEAGPNVSVRGYDIIEEIKTELEKTCPNVVSCADIMALSTRDGVRLAGGPAYEVPTGRRDSLESRREDADNLPGPDIGVPKLIEQFSEKGFSTQDMVVLLAGGHTIGTAKCFFIEVDAAPIDPVYRTNITSQCDGKDGEKGAVNLDMITPDLVDANYFALVLGKKMPLTVDRLMGLDPRTMPIVQNMATKPADFIPLFAKAMEKLSVMKVLTGKDGEIRKSCSEFNNPVATDDGPSVIRISSLLPGEMEGLSPGAGKSVSGSRKMAGGGGTAAAAAAASNAAAGGMGGGAETNKVVGNEATLPTNSVPAATEVNNVADNQAANNAIGGEAANNAIGGGAAANNAIGGAAANNAIGGAVANNAVGGGAANNAIDGGATNNAVGGAAANNAIGGAAAANNAIGGAAAANNAIGGAAAANENVAGNNEAAASKESMKKKARAEAAQRTTGRQSFSMAAAGDGGQQL